MANLTIQGVFPTAAGQNTVSIVIPVASPGGQVLTPALASGFNAIAIPAGTTLIIVVLPVGNTQTVTLKGPTGDTGIPINKNTGVIMFMPDAADTTFGLTTGGAIAALTTIYFL